MTDTATAGHNSGYDKALFFAHLQKATITGADKDAAAADHSSAMKTAKVDQIPAEDLRFAMQAIKAEDQDAFVDRVRRKLLILEWLGMATPIQGDLFADRRPLDDRLYDEGVADGLRGMTLSEVKGQNYARGWHAGQELLASGIQKMGQGAGTAGDDDADPFEDEAGE